jgi:hypothetical protein
MFRNFTLDESHYGKFNPPLGILTLAFAAQLHHTVASAGPSIFEGGAIHREAGRMVARNGGMTLALARDTAATLHRLGNLGAHVDLDSGAISVTSPESSRVRVHADDALLRSASRSVTQAQIKILSAKAIEVTMWKGNFDFSYCEELQVLQEGQTYCSYLDSARRCRARRAVGQ